MQPASAPDGPPTPTADVERSAVAVLRPAELLLVALGVVLLSALGELALLAVQKFGQGYVLRTSPSVVWMTPVAIAAIFALGVLPLLILSRVWPRFARLSTVVAVCTFLGFLGFLLVERRLTVWALALLSLGVAFQAGRLAEKHRVGFLRLVRRGTLALFALFLIAAAFAEGGMAVRERRSEAGLQAARAGSPNVIFIILDTVRALSLSLYGYPRKTTPNLERFAARGVVFERAIVPGTWTVPSHGSMLTGHWPHVLERASWWAPREVAPMPTITEALRDQGYRTGGFVGNWYHIGRETAIARGFTHYSDIDRSPAHIARGSAMVRWLFSQRGFKKLIGLYETLGRRSAPQVSRAFLRWLDRKSDRPFFAFLNYFDAHSPYLPPAPFDTRFGLTGADREPVVIEELNRRVDPEPGVVQAEIDAYDGGIAYVDHQMGILFEELERRDKLDNTVIIIAADHGEELGEHGRWGHAYSLHGEVVHVPLLIITPGGPAGVRVAQPASLRNVAATIADLTGLDGPRFPGVSLASYWRAADAGAIVEDTILSVFGKYRSLYSGEYHYLEDVFVDRERIYDYVRDPNEREDLAASPEAQRAMVSIRTLLARIAPPVQRRQGSEPAIPPPER